MYISYIYENMKCQIFESGTKLNGKDVYYIIPDEDGFYALSNYMIIGWDDNIEIEINDKTYRGAWLLKSYDDKYAYLSYKYEFGELYYIKDVARKDWDKSYDSVNNVQSTSYTKYYDKVDNSREKITKVIIDVKKEKLYYNNKVKLYILDVKNKSECIESANIYKSEFIGMNITKNNNGTFTYNGKNYSGISIDVSEYLKPDYDDMYYDEYLTKTIDVNIDNVFKNNICVLTVPDIVNVDVFTKQLDDKKTPIVESNFVKYTNNKYYIDNVVSNIESGEKIEYRLINEYGWSSNLSYDKNGMYDYDDYKEKDNIKIRNNYVVNNVAHTEIEVKNRSNRYILEQLNSGGYYSSEYFMIENGQFKKITNDSNICTLSVDNNYPVINDNVKENVVLKVKCLYGGIKGNSELSRRLKFTKEGILEVKNIISYKLDNDYIYEYTLEPIKKGVTNVEFDQNFGKLEFNNKATLKDNIYVLNDKVEVVCSFDKPEVDEVVKGSVVNYKVTCVGSDIEAKYNDSVYTYLMFEGYKINKGDITQIDENKIVMNISIKAREKQGYEGGDINGLHLLDGSISNKYGYKNEITYAEPVKVLNNDSNVSDDKRPQCSFSASDKEVTIDDTITFTLKCTDKYGELKFGFVNTNGINTETHLLFFERLELLNVSEAKIEGDSTYYIITAKGKNIGKTNIYLTAGAIKNKYGFTNKYVESPKVKVKAKPLLNGCN